MNFVRVITIFDHLVLLEYEQSSSLKTFSFFIIVCCGLDEDRH